MAPRQAWEGQRAEANGTLRPGRVQLLTQRLQVAQSGSAHQALARPPQQCGATQVHQGAVAEGAALTFCLRGATVRREVEKVRGKKTKDRKRKVSSAHQFPPAGTRARLPQGVHVSAH